MRALSRLRRVVARRQRLSDGTLSNRESLKLLYEDGWRPGWTRHEVTDAEGRTHKVWAPPRRLPLGMRMHGWLALAPTVVLAATVIWLLSKLPSWALWPAAEFGIGIGILHHFGMLPNPLRWLGL